MTERFWDHFRSWEEAEAAWGAATVHAAVDCPLKTSPQPAVPSIAPGERALRWKGLHWVLQKDAGFVLVRRLLRHPFRYFLQYVRSVLNRSPYQRAEDLFFYGIKNQDEMRELLRRDDTFLVVGFSYCQKPHECPSTRFSDACIHSLDNPVCRQCTICKAVHTLPPTATSFVVVPTINAIGKVILEAVDAHPNKRVVFIITACEMALQMFTDMGNMVGVCGVGIRLGGRVCNTFRAFALSEEGIKPGLTTVLPSTQHHLFSLLRTWREARQQEKTSHEQDDRRLSH